MWPPFMILNRFYIMNFDLRGQGGQNGGQIYKINFNLPSFNLVFETSWGSYAFLNPKFWPWRSKCKVYFAHIQLNLLRESSDIQPMQTFNFDLRVILIFNHNLPNFWSLVDSWMGFSAPLLWPNRRPCSKYSLFFHAWEFFKLIYFPHCNLNLFWFFF